MAPVRIGEPSRRQRGGSLTASQSTVARVEFVLVRHGQPEWVRDGFNVADPPLTELGQRQASRMAEALAPESVRRSARLAPAPGTSDGGAALPCARPHRSDRPVVGGDPRSELARHPGRVRASARIASWRSGRSTPGGTGSPAASRCATSPPASTPAPRSSSPPTGCAGSITSCRSGRSTSRAADPARRPRRHELGVHVPSARPAADAVGVGPVRVRACLREPDRGAPGPRRLHVQPHRRCRASSTSAATTAPADVLR